MGVYVIYFSGGREDGVCTVGAEDPDQARRVFRIRIGDEWSIDRVLTREEYEADARAADPTYTGLRESEIPELRQAIVLDLGT